MTEISTQLKQFGVRPELVQPGNEQLGSDLAMPCFTLAKELKKSPQAIAEEISACIEHQDVARAEAVAGYVNVWFSDSVLIQIARSATEVPQVFSGQTVVCEYSDPNPFKVLHAGHLYTSIVGDAVANLYELSGADVKRVNFGGDVGLHVAKTMYAILQNLGGEHPDKLQGIASNERSNWLSARYVEGNAAYEQEDYKDVIVELNKQIYNLHTHNDKTSAFAQIYWTTRQWSYDYFDQFYDYIGTKFDKYYPESQTAELGLQTVKEQLANGTFEKSGEAVIFNGEAHGLHTRVFVNSNGLPTYEAKDIGLALHKWRDYEFDRSVMITGNDITEYMKVILKALEQFEPEIAKRSKHVTHGMVKLQGGVKMSSRLGNFLKAQDIIDFAFEAAATQSENAEKPVVLAAIKYSFLKQGIGQDIHFDPQDSVSLHGNSGPYLQYAHARACSISAKAATAGGFGQDLDPQERALIQKIAGYSQAVASATEAMSPSKVCTYLYELTTAFNKFYETSRIVGDEREQHRLAILTEYKKVLSSGLVVLGITPVEQM